MAGRSLSIVFAKYTNTSFWYTWAPNNPCVNKRSMCLCVWVTDWFAYLRANSSLEHHFTARSHNEIHIVKFFARHNEVSTKRIELKCNELCGKASFWVHLLVLCQKGMEDGMLLLALAFWHHCVIYCRRLRSLTICINSNIMKIWLKGSSNKIPEVYCILRNSLWWWRVNENLQHFSYCSSRSLSFSSCHP